MSDLKELARHFYNVLDGQDKVILSTLVSPEFVARVGSMQPMTFSEWFDGLRFFYSGFPDGHHLIDDYVLDESRVVTRCRFEGTHDGAFLGKPPSGKKISVGAIHIDRFVKGVLAEHAGQIDLLGLMQQIGALPPPG